MGNLRGSLFAVDDSDDEYGEMVREGYEVKVSIQHDIKKAFRYFLNAFLFSSQRLFILIDLGNVLS